MKVPENSLVPKVLLAACLWTMTVVPADAEPDGTLIGAIRWDGWYGDGDVVKAVETSLGQPKYHFRLPWFAKVNGDGTVRINGDSQAIMEQEIAYALLAGLNYWAFVDYWDEAPGMSIALNRYLSAANREGLRYCLVEEGHRLDKFGAVGWGRLVRHFENPGYQTVLDGRPLLYVFLPPAKLGSADWDELRRQTVAAGLKSPYLVLMGYRPEQDAKAKADLGFDAVSAYARGGSYSMTQPAFAEQCAMIRRDRWEKWQALGVPAITFASTGWDTRPRNERPPFWMRDEVKAEPDPTPFSRQKPLLDAVTATPGELANHVCEAVRWAGSHRDLNPANTVIIYAWNEHDEGGWLQPTLRADGTADDSRVLALGKALQVLRSRPSDESALPPNPATR
jgi:hypothetical protein